MTFVRPKIEWGADWETIADTAADGPPAPVRTGASREGIVDGRSLIVLRQRPNGSPS